MLKSTTKLFLLFIFVVFTNSYSQESKIFWINQGASKIQSSNLNGSNVTDIVTGLQIPEGIAVDCTRTPMKVYYSERGADRIVRVNIDGSNPEEIITGVTGIKDIELDLVNRKIYWAKDTYSDDRISRADMDSLNSNIEDLYSSSYAMHGFNGIGIDTINHWVFWTQSRYAALDVIKRMTFAGTNDTLIGYFLNPKDIEVFGDKIYWSWYSARCLMSAYNNGSGVDTVLTNIYSLHFEINATIGKIYWTDFQYNKICCANLDGSERTDLVTAIPSPKGIALYINPNTMFVEQTNKTPQKYMLKQNYPNPFNPRTNIQFSIPKTEHVTLKIYNMLGQEIATLVSDKLAQGHHKYTWDASDFASGVYYYKIEAGTFIQTKKLVLLK
jgi:hypothetical protein